MPGTSAYTNIDDAKEAARQIAFSLFNVGKIDRTAQDALLASIEASATENDGFDLWSEEANISEAAAFWAGLRLRLPNTGLPAAVASDLDDICVSAMGVSQAETAREDDQDYTTIAGGTAAASAADLKSGAAATGSALTNPWFLGTASVLLLAALYAYKELQKELL